MNMVKYSKHNYVLFIRNILLNDSMRLEELPALSLWFNIVKAPFVCFHLQTGFHFQTGFHLLLVVTKYLLLVNTKYFVQKQSRLSGLSIKDT